MIRVDVLDVPGAANALPSAQVQGLMLQARVMGGRGRQVVFDRFSADAMAERFAALCAREILKRGPIVGKAS